MKSLSFKQELAWLEWAQKQVLAKYGWEAAIQNDPAVIEPPQFEAEHLALIRRTTAI